MATNNPVPEKIRNFNVYTGPTASQRMMGISGEVALPEFAYSTEEVSGAGILGSFESPNAGHTDSTEMEIPLRLITPEDLDLAVGDMADLTLRAATQHTDTASRKIVEQGLIINVCGPVKKIKIGKLEVGKPMDAAITVEVMRFEMNRDSEGSLSPLLKIDKTNFEYEVNGVDKLAGMRRYI